MLIVLLLHHWKMLLVSAFVGNTFSLLLSLFVIKLYSHFFSCLGKKTQQKTGLLNLRGSDFDYLPVFFAYAIITEKETYLYLMNHERATKNNKIDNHFQTEHIDITINEYNDTLAGINMVVSDYKYEYDIVISDIISINQYLNMELSFLFRFEIQKGK